MDSPATRYRVLDRLGEVCYVEEDMASLQIVLFVLWMTASVLFAVVGLTRRGNPHFVGRWLAHRRMGHRHGRRGRLGRRIESDNG